MDDAHFIEVYELYYQGLFRFCFTYVHDKDEAENIVQDVFCDFYQKPPKDERNLKSWLFTCTCNKAKNYIKRRKKTKEVYLEYFSDISLEDNATKELCSKMVCELEKIPEKYKDVINYFYFGDLSILEISKVLQISESNVKKRLERGRSILKNKMEGGDNK